MTLFFNPLPLAFPLYNAGINFLNEEEEDLESHVNGGCIANKPCNGTSGLSWNDCVDDGVNDAADG